MQATQPAHTTHDVAPARESFAPSHSVRPVARPVYDPPEVMTEAPSAPHYIETIVDLPDTPFIEESIVRQIPNVLPEPMQGTTLEQIEITTPEPPRRAGDVMEDGSIYVGTMSDSGLPLYTTHIDTMALNTRAHRESDQFVSPRFGWNEAQDFCAGLEYNGHSDWQLPTLAQAQLMYQNQSNGALSGTFHQQATVQDPGFYWLSEEGTGVIEAQSNIDPRDYAMVFRFADGFSAWSLKENHPRRYENVESRIRCVRLG